VLDGTYSLPSERVESNRQFLAGLTADDHVLVAEIDGRVMGIAGLHVRGGKQRHVAALGIAVHDRYQGQGIGRQLMAALLDLADNWLGLLRVELEVFADNTRAIGLYESLGFRHEGRRVKGVFRRGGYADTLTMARLRDGSA
jgi:putative acetyltransferase